MRIAWHIGLPKSSDGRIAEPEKLWRALAEYAGKIVHPFTTIELRFIEGSTSKLFYPYLSLVNNALLVEDVLKCQEEGFDAVVLAPAIDPALDESRAAASIPVVGSLESAMAISVFVGRRVSAIGIRDGYITMIEQNISRYGLRHRMIENRPVRLWEMQYRDLVQALKGDGAEFITQFESVALELINDGADVIVGGCQLFGCILDRLGYTTIADKGVPFVDCAAAGLKMAESMVSLGRSVGLKKSESRFSPFRSMDPALLEEAATVRRS
jgi:Asp/Glu/hydantoin racemase